MQDKLELTFYRDESKFAIEVEKSLISKINRENLNWNLRALISNASHKIPILSCGTFALRGYYDIVTVLDLEYSR